MVIKPDVPELLGDFSFMTNHLSRLMLETAFASAVQHDLLDLLRNCDPPPNTPMMFWNPVSCLSNDIERRLPDSSSAMIGLTCSALQRHLRDPVKFRKEFVNY
jgi:hypothetical protein